jgi:HEPN domain-containing protein
MSARRGGHQSWIAKAESDLLNIRNNRAATEVPWDTVCFHAQQVAEKMLKAFLVANGRPASRPHDLVALLSVSAEIEPALEPLEGDCRNLTTYAIAARYPVPLAEPTEREAREMVRAAERVRAALLKLLAKE